jgi:DNA-binding NtrC family response regulator
MKSGALIDAARLAADDRDWRRMSRPPCPVEPLSRSVTLVDGVSTQPDTDKEFIVGDPAMLNLMKTARKVAMSDAPVLVTGETGVGKEILARYIHRASNRANGPLVKVNCAALPPALIEAELFGHEKGAFTGADERRVGFLESANLGTVILDEITELPGSVQVKLLRFLDDYTINRVGMTEEVLLDVRVIALTNRDVEEEIRIGSFRQDLFYRLGTFHLYIPPLRSRTVDIPLLAEYFARKVAQRFEMETPTLGSRFIERLKSHSWPGNVRELRNAMESAVIHCEGDRLTSQHVPVTITSKVTIDGQDSPVLVNIKQRTA